MFPYWLLFSIFALGSLEYRRRGDVGSQTGLLFLAAGVFVALMIGFRYEVGGDWGSYQRMFNETRYLALGVALGQGDPGYSILNWVAQWLEIEVWFVNLACGTIFTWGLVKFARRQPSPWLAALVAVPYLIIVVAMGYTRQAAAIGFILAALATIDTMEMRRGSVVRLLVYTLGAVLFHKSAIIVLPLVAIAWARGRFLVIAVLLLLTVITYYLIVASSVDRLVSGYVSSGYEAQGALIRTAMNVPPALLFLRFLHKFELGPSQRVLWRNFSIAAILAFAAVLASASSVAIDRLALYLLPLQMFVLSRLPEVFGSRGSPHGQVVLAVVAYSAMIQFTWLNYAENAHYWIPYEVYPLIEPSY